MTSPASMTGVQELPPAVPPTAWWRQSLGEGAPGIALLHTVRAAAGSASWATVQAWLREAARDGVTASPHASLFYGLPAVAYALAFAHQPEHKAALDTLNGHVIDVASRRLDAATTRLAERSLPRLAEYDLISGLTGIGVYLLHHQPKQPVVRDILAYLVRLTEPLDIDGTPVPGWWCAHGPTEQLALPGGHGNLGMAHGIAGPLALLSIALKKHIRVPGHQAAIARICGWLDDWRRESDHATWWPEWITLGEQRTGMWFRDPGRPSWCYGTPGLARAQQLAGHATGDGTRRHIAEQALITCVTDRGQLAQLTDASLCHGWAGLVHTVWRAAADDTSGRLAELLPQLRTRLLQVQPAHGSAGFLEGRAGYELAVHTTSKPVGEPPLRAWDAGLLTNG